MRQSSCRWLLIPLIAIFVSGCIPPGQKIVQTPPNKPNAPTSQPQENPAQCKAPEEARGEGQGAYLPATLDQALDPLNAPWPEAVWESSRSTARTRKGPRAGIHEESIVPDEDEEKIGAGDEEEGSPEEKPAQQMLDEALSFCGESQDFWQKGELENALDALDQAYTLILAADVGDAPRLFQQKEDLRFMISRRILEIYASRHTVATGNHNAIPMADNEHVDLELKLFTDKEKDFFVEAYRRSGRLRPMIVEEMKSAGLPEELSWLPLIESGFKLRAISSARALGPWQFIASTGYKFGLSRDEYVDERMDPVKSTIAAIAYLKELHQIFGDWTTVLAAYNCGEGRVLRTIKAGGVNYLDNFWDLYGRLPRETARYVPRFLAALLIINNPEKYGMELPEPAPPLEFDTVAIQRQVHLADVAKALDAQEEELKALNPELRLHVTPKTSYTLRVPKGMGETLLAKVDAIPERGLPRPAYASHKIRPGETLSTIARRYRVTVSAISRANNLSGKHYIVAGRTLKIPLGGTVAEEASVALAKQDATPIKHVVQRGDSLWNLAQRYGTTVAAIQKANGLSGSSLLIGQKLTVPGGKGVPADKASRTYVVRIGDCPASIAGKHNMDLIRFLAVNGLSSRSKIYPGQKLSVD
ncbi:MAG: LysM peptidoglycan-binding domain-containing protein [Pseudomonadota bacterium]